LTEIKFLVIYFIKSKEGKMKKLTVLALLAAVTIAVGYQRIVVLEEAYSEG
jgi:hypothetical protein